MKIITLIGGRPQFIKEAILHKEWKKNQVTEILVNSGQHYDFNMAESFLRIFDIKDPEYNLKVGSGKHGEMTAKIMTAFEKVVEKENPDKIIVFGDTNTTLAGALIAAKQKIPLAHVEAGIRMNPKDMPEEINRVLTDRVASYLFCPTKKSVENLQMEGIQEGIYLTGDIAFDLFLKMQPYFSYDMISSLNLEENRYAIVTLHRDYNVDDQEKLAKLLKSLSRINKELPIVFPIHPRTKKRISEFGIEGYLTGINVIDPIDYFQLMGLASKANKIITDSGGLQKEAYFLNVPALVVMPDTGWSELIDEGCNVLCNEDNLYHLAKDFIGKKAQKNIYGTGDSGKKMVKILLDN
jgi:UDP-N-acetylglucosamine 2-epimerase (non-hydrolysing)